MFETPEVLDDCPPRLFMRFMEKAIDRLEMTPDTLELTPETFELPEGPDSTLDPDPGLFYWLLSGGPDPPDLEVEESPFLIKGIYPVCTPLLNLGCLYVFCWLSTLKLIIFSELGLPLFVMLCPLLSWLGSAKIFWRLKSSSSRPRLSISLDIDLFSTKEVEIIDFLSPLDFDSNLCYAELIL